MKVGLGAMLSNSPEIAKTAQLGLFESLAGIEITTTKASQNQCILKW